MGLTVASGTAACSQTATACVLARSTQGGAAEDGGGVDPEDVRADSLVQARPRHHRPVLRRGRRRGGPGRSMSQGGPGCSRCWTPKGGAAPPGSKNPKRTQTPDLHAGKDVAVVETSWVPSPRASCSAALLPARPNPCCLAPRRLRPAEKGLSDLAAHYLVKAGISAIRRLRKTDNNRIARACGATIVSRPGGRGLRAGRALVVGWAGAHQCVPGGCGVFKQGHWHGSTAGRPSRAPRHAWQTVSRSAICR